MSFQKHIPLFFVKQNKLLLRPKTTQSENRKTLVCMLSLITTTTEQQFGWLLSKISWDAMLLAGDGRSERIRNRI